MKLSDIDLLKIGNTINLAGAVFVGEGKMFLCMFPEDTGRISAMEVEPDDRPLPNETHVPIFHTFANGGQASWVKTLEMNADDWQKFLRQTDLLETEVLAKASDGTLAKIILRKSERQIDAGVQWRVYKRDGYRCRYCGKDDLPLTVDHLVTHEEGGPMTEENLVAADRKCNKVRGNLSYEEWLKHPRYLETSKNLTPEVRAANEALVATLDKIPRKAHVKSR